MYSTFGKKSLKSVFLIDESITRNPLDSPECIISPPILCREAKFVLGPDPMLYP